MDLNTKFVTEKQLNLTFISERHIESVSNLYSDPEVLKGHGLRRPMPSEFWEMALDGEPTHLGVNWILTYGDYQSPKVFAHGAINQWMPNPQSAEIHCSVDPAFWGSGIGTLVVKCLLREAKSQGLLYIWVGILETNERSKRLFKSFGFEEKAVLPFYGVSDKGVPLSRLMWVKEL